MYVFASFPKIAVLTAIVQVGSRSLLVAVTVILAIPLASVQCYTCAIFIHSTIIVLTTLLVKWCTICSASCYFLLLQYF